MSIQRIQDTRKIVASRNPSNSLGRVASTYGTLFQQTNGSDWGCQNYGGTESPPIIIAGEPYSFGNMVMDRPYVWLPYSFPATANVGYVVDVELSAGDTLIIGYLDGGYLFRFTDVITSSGRYTGSFVISSQGMVRTLTMRGAPWSGNPVTIKELFFFDADSYSYEDFLQSPNVFLSTEQKDTPDSISATSPRLGWADAIPTTGNWRVGDRLENTAWTGAFSSTIAWVCTVAGTPGTWKAVSLFDAYNASKDPYFYSFIGASGAWQTLDIAPSVSTMTPGQLVLNCGATGYALVQQATANCCMGGELITVEAIVTGQTNAAAAQLRPANDTIAAVTFGAPGSTSTDRTILIGASSPGTFWIRNATPNSIHTFSKLIVRPKYPFLTKAPANFPASLPVLVITSYASAVPNIWYTHNVANTVSGGILTMSSWQPIWQRVTIRAGKTYRFRMNQVSLGATQNSIHIINSAGGLEVLSLLLPLTLGIVEVTFVAAVNGVGITFQSNATTSTTDYARFYSE